MIDSRNGLVLMSDQPIYVYVERIDFATADLDPCWIQRSGCKNVKMHLFIHGLQS
jgi:hypothetical protein